MFEHPPLSPCVTRATSHIDESVTAWEFASYLLKMHPEYTHHKMTESEFQKIDRKYHGEKKPSGKWLESISKKYPNEKLFHTKLVILGLIEIDPILSSLFSQEILQVLRSEITFRKLD